MTENNFKSKGYALAIGIFLMFVTMVLHPVGGNINHLIRITNIIIISHSIAILSIPFSLVGYWGIAKKLGIDSFFSITAFSVTMIAMFSALCAATINGLAVPFFVKRYEEASPDLLKIVDQILDYSFSLNHAFDFIFIFGMSLAVILWSVRILTTEIFPKWVGYLGISFVLLAFSSIALGHNLVDLHGFRLFVIGVIVWSLICAYFLIAKQKVKL